MAEWRRVKIGDALKEVSREEKLNPNTKYRLLGVRWYGNGVFQREEKLGKEIKATKLYRAKKGDFIYNRLFAWKSSFAIVPDEFDGCLVSNEFPLFICDESKFLADFLLSYILLPQNIDTVNRLSGGMSSVSRKRFKEIDFLNFEIPQYDISFQKSICQKLKKISAIAESQDLESNTHLSLLKQLRQAVLQEAIEGKLTAKWRKHNPELIRGENHASKLLEKIKAEKERLNKEGKIKKDKPLPPITDDEKPFVLPDGWVWCRLGDLLRISSGDGLIAKDMAKGGEYPVFGGNGINGYHDKFNVSKSTIVIGRVGALCGAIHVTPEKAWVTDNAFITYYAEHLLCGSWLERLLVALNLRDRARETAQPVISGKRVYPITVALPPYAEQEAVVQAVNNFMAMIDELEKQVSDRKEHSEMLMQSVLREAFEN